MASKKLTRHDSPNDPKTNRKRKSGRVSAKKGGSYRSQDGAKHEPQGDSQLADTSSAFELHKPDIGFGKRVHISSEPAWVKFSDRKLLEMKISELGLDFEQTSMVDFRDKLHAELKQLGLVFKPHCWFSDDWFSPDNVPGIAVPFYICLLYTSPSPRDRG